MALPELDFECAIAKSQINRYVKGEKLSDPVMSQLHLHLESCSHCRSHLESKEKMLASQTSVRHVSPPTTEVQSVANPMIRAHIAAELTQALDMEDVPPAFAHKEAQAASTAKARKVKLAVNQLEREQIAAQRKAANAERKQKQAWRNPLAALALYRRLPDSEPLTMETARKASQTLRQQPTKKPILFALALMACVAVMSFVMKDPTQLLGSKPKVAPVIATQKDSPVAVKNPRAEEFRKIRTATAIAEAPVAPTPDKAAAHQIKPIAKQPQKTTPATKVVKPIAKTPAKPKSATPVKPIKRSSAASKRSAKPPKRVTSKTDSIRKSPTQSSRPTSRVQEPKPKKKAPVTKTLTSKSKRKTPSKSTKTTEVKKSTRKPSTPKRASAKTSRRTGSVKVYGANGEVIN